MNDPIFSEVNQSASKMGGCDPLWLRDNKAPEFQTVELGGSGPTMILLHGLFGALSNWDTTLPYFAEFSRVIALQFPILTGHRSEVKVKALAAYTEYFIRSRSLDRVVLCGNSLGGHVAMRLALARPELVDCLILSGTSGLYEHSVDSLPVRPSSQFIRDHMKRVFYNQEFITDAAVNDILRIISDRRNHLNLIHAARSAKKDNLLNLLKDIVAPTLLLWGQDDEVTTMQVAKIFNQHIPKSTLEVIENCGHAPMIEHPRWFADRVKDFLQGNSRYYLK